VNKAYESALLNKEDNGMDNYQTLIEKAKKGFETLDLPEHFKTDALESAEDLAD
jgi:hypothetical protein